MKSEDRVLMDQLKNKAEVVTRAPYRTEFEDKLCKKRRRRGKFSKAEDF